jgi:chromosome segregation ATPase
MAMAATAGKPMTGEIPGISGEELDQRVAVLRRFRTLLTEQRDRFRSYLEALDRQQQVIETGSAEELIAHVELEEKIVADIFSIQKVIDPLEEMYRHSGGAYPAAHAEYAEHAAQTPHAAGDDVRGLKAALEELEKEAVIRSGRNRELLSRRMAEIRSEIKALRTNPYLQSIRSAFSPPPALVDISG